MITGFWKKLKKPLYVTAPMANVTDAAFRKMIAKYSKPDVIWTEFVSCDGLMSDGRENIMIDLKYEDIERPIVAQIFGSKPENFYRTALLLQDMGFDGIDINMGCPDKNVEKQGAGANLIKKPKLAQEIILETKRGAGKIPVSVKTRIGYNKNEIENWLPYLLETEPAAITVHARTRKEMSLVPARWETVAEAVRLRDKHDNSSNKTLIIGNGDVKDIVDAEKKVKESGADGAMVGRGLFGNPWFFDPNKLPSLREKLEVLVEHTYLFEKLLGNYKNFDLMKKHFKAYVTGFSNAKELRIRLMEAKNGKDVENTIIKFLLSELPNLESTGVVSK